MNKKNITIIGISIISIIIIVVILSAGSMIIDSPVLVILATIDFIRAEQEYMELVESTEEAKLFRETFPDVRTEYYLEIGKRTLVLTNNEYGDDTALYFRQFFDRTLSISYWCPTNEESLYGSSNNIDELKDSGCF